MKAQRLAAVCIGMAIATLGLMGAPVGADEFPTESSLVYTGFTYYYDLAVDVAGNAHAFIDETLEDRLYYSNNVGGTWGTPQYIDDTSDWGTINVSGAVDSLGFAHIAYDTGPGGGGGNDILTYATNGSGSWDITQVRSTSRWYSIALSPAGEPRVSYYYDYSGLNYAILTGSTWTHEVVDSTGDIATYAGRYSDLAVDNNDHAHIVYYNYTTDAVRYASNSSGTWQWEELVSNPDSGYAEVALGPDGTVLAAYRADGRIWLSRRQNDSWETVPVTDVGSFGDLDVKADDSGAAYVVYNDSAAANLKLAIERDGSFEHYDIFSSEAGGSGPILQIHDRTVHVLAWKREAEQLFHLRGTLPLAGDFDGDGDVDLSDLAFLLSDYGCAGGDCPGDIDGDGDTDLADLAILLANYGAGV
jgi:hypothetical protein